MILTDEDALLCDFVETYGIINYRGLPLQTAAALACGLRENSRIMMILSETKVDINTMLSASAVDCMRILIWQNTEDGRNGRNIPESIVNKLISAEDKSKNREYETYASGDDFKAAWKAIVGD